MEPKSLNFAIHETALAVLGICTATALLLTKPASFVCLETLLCTAGYVASLQFAKTRRAELDPRIRFFAAFAFATWFYCSVARVTPALGFGLRDTALLRLDERIFNHTPGVYFQKISTAWLTDLMTLCYISYHIYLALVLIAIARSRQSRSILVTPALFLGFAVGMAIYLLVPAIGPLYAFPQLFPSTLPKGIISKFFGYIIEKGSSVYDVFPSLHVLITCMLLDFDWQCLKTRFWIMLFPSLGLAVSTMYLGYHYGVDLVAGLLLYFILRPFGFSHLRKETGCSP